MSYAREQRRKQKRANESKDVKRIRREIRNGILPRFFLMKERVKVQGTDKIKEQLERVPLSDKNKPHRQHLSLRLRSTLQFLTKS